MAQMKKSVVFVKFLLWNPCEINQLYSIVCKLVTVTLGDETNSLNIWSTSLKDSNTRFCEIHEYILVRKLDISFK